MKQFGIIVESKESSDSDSQENKNSKGENHKGTPEFKKINV